MQGRSFGEETLGVSGCVRYHSDDSIEIKYYDRPAQFVDKMAFLLTGNAGCEPGGGVSCYGDSAKGPKQSFLGFMFYDRGWFHNDKYGLTLGGDRSNNPGRYLVVLPPINGATAITGTPYFTKNSGDPFKAWDVFHTYNYMPSQYITFLWKFDHRARMCWTGLDQKELHLRAVDAGSQEDREPYRFGDSHQILIWIISSPFSVR